MSALAHLSLTSSCGLAVSMHARNIYLTNHAQSWDNITQPSVQHSEMTSQVYICIIPYTAYFKRVYECQSVVTWAGMEELNYKYLCI